MLELITVETGGWSEIGVKNEGVLTIFWALMRNRNVRVIAVTGLISGIYIGMLNGVLQLFPGTLSLSVAGLGILQSLGGRFNGVATSIVQPLAGHYADVRGRKIVIVFGSITTILSMMFLAGAAVTGSWILLSAGFVLFGLSTLGNPASQAVIAESVSLDSTRMNIAYSAVFLLSIAPGVVTPYLAGVAADNNDYLAIFVVAALLESVDLYLYVKELAETKHDPLRDGNGLARRFSFVEALKPPKGDIRYFSTLAMDSFAFGISSSIIYAIMKANFGISSADVGLQVSVLSLSIVASQYPATRLLLKIGARRTIIISEMLGVVLMAGWTVATTLPEFLILSVVFGVSVSTWVPGVSSMLMAHSRPDQRGSIGGKLAAIRGLVAFPAPIIGALLYQTLGYQAPMIASLIGAVVTVVMMFRFLPRATSGALLDRPQEHLIPVQTS